MSDSISRVTLLMLLLAPLALVGSGGCGSRVETRRKIEEGKTDTSGSEEHTGYRSWEGSSGQSADEANAQLGGY